MPNDRPVLSPTAEHPITITPTQGRVTVTAGGTVIADTAEALALAEAAYPIVQYIPLEDVDQTLLSDSTTETYCPYKGDASYYDVTVDGTTLEDLIWRYREPYVAVAQIAGYVAFYPDRGAQVVEV